MARNADSQTPSNLALSGLLVVIFALIAALLLLSAFIIWFAEVINSLTLSLLLTAIVSGTVAWSIYKVKLSPTLQRLREEYEMIASIAKLIRRGCNSALCRLIELLDW